MWKKSFDFIDQKSDENGSILITEAIINEDDFIVIHIYSSNTESEQFSTMQNMLDDIKISNKQGGNPVPQKKSRAKLIEINESLYLCDIWSI